jgi:hypothetical protein
VCWVYVFVFLQTQLVVYVLTGLDNASEVGVERGVRVERAMVCKLCPITELGLEGDGGSSRVL